VALKRLYALFADPLTSSGLTLL